MKQLRILEKCKSTYFLIGTLSLFFLLRLPSLFEPYWYGDEGIYQVLGLAIRSGRLLYRDIWDNKPPLLYILYALFSSDQFTLRLVSLIFGLLAVITFFILSNKLFTNKIATYISTLFFAIFFGLPVIEGNIANSENFMLFPILISGLIIVNYSSYKNKSDLKYHSIAFLAGLILSFAFLFKIVAIFDFAAFVLFLIFIEYKRLKDFIPTVINLFSFFLGFTLPIILTALFFAASNAFPDFLTASFKQNVGYVGYGNKLLIPQGLLIFKLILLTITSIFIFIKRKNLNITRMFILLWLAFSLFNAFFAQRPYIHYLLVLLPSFSLFLGLLIWDKKLQKVYIVFLIFLLIILSTSFRIYGKTNRYYQNFLSFITGSKNVPDYLAFFDRSTPNDYELAQFVRSHTNENDNIFIWGNNAQVYKMSNKLPPGRFTVAYHITAKKEFLKETFKDFNKQKPKYIIITSPQNPFPYLLTGYSLKLIINNSIIYERTP